MIGKMKRALLIPSAVVLFGALAFACGDEEDGEGDAGGATSGNAGGTTGGGECDPTALKPYKTKTVDATDTEMAVPNVKVEVIDDETGLPLSPPSTFMSDGNGNVTLQVNACKPFGIKAHAASGHTDTYSYHALQARSGTAEALVRMGSDNASALVPMLAIYDVDDNRAPAAGSVYWKTPKMTYYDVVGCAQIEYEKGAIPADWSLRFFKDRLPSSLADWPLEKGTRKGDGRFFVGNAEPGKHTFIAKVKGETIGTADIVIFPRTTGSTMVSGHPANLFLAGIYIDAPEGATNPTPADCTQ